MEIMNTDTPETDQAERESIAAYIEAYGPDAVFPCDGYDHARKLERERDEIRAQLREEQQLHVQTLNERDEARQWESQALVARIQRDQFSKTLGEVREILCDALPTEDAPTRFMAAKLVRERDEARERVDTMFVKHAEILDQAKRERDEARNNLNPHWVVVDSQTNQKP